VRQVPVRELNQDTAGVLARVQRGEEIEVTSNGRPIALILPVRPHPLSGLVAAGLVHPARRSLDLTVSPDDVDSAAGDVHEGLAGLVAADRQDRL
jgi:prevent-host-death family protein